MKCYNCGNDVVPYKQLVIQWTGPEEHNFCPICKCNLTLQHNFVNKMKEAIAEVRAVK